MAGGKDKRYNRYYSNREIATVKKKTKFIQALKDKLGNIAAASEAAEVCRVSIFRWMREDPEFAEAVDEVRKSASSVFESILFKKIMAGDTTCLLYYLNNIGKVLGYNLPQTQNVQLNFKPIEPIETDMNVWAKELDEATIGPETDEPSTTSTNDDDSQSTTSA